jgi:hypothetical protein
VDVERSTAELHSVEAAHSKQTSERSCGRLHKKRLAMNRKFAWGSVTQARRRTSEMFPLSSFIAMAFITT